MRLILTLACAVLTAFGQSTNGPIVLTGEPSPYVVDSMGRTIDYHMFWRHIGTNICELNLVTNVVTQWLPIEKIASPRGDQTKQIGILVTNQVLTVIAYDKTNEVILKMLGREEWPSQKRVVVEPLTHGGPRLTPAR